MFTKIAPLALSASIAEASFSGHGKYNLSHGSSDPKGDCSNFNGSVGCTSGTQTRYPDEWAKRSFQTFLKDGPDAHLYKPGYEGLGRVMCYTDIVYSADRKSANVTAKCRKHDSIVKMEYNWNNEGF